MIFVARSAKPQILKKNESGWLADLKTAANPLAKEKAAKKYAHREIRESLVAMFHGKCAYCESYVKHVGYPNIEHFRPRNGPRGNEDLTFTWDNLLLSCTVCNGPQYKSDKFPNAAEGGPLLNPCADNPDDHLEFHYDPVAKIAAVLYKTTRGKLTEEIIGLNRLDLKIYRSKHVRRIAALAKLAGSYSEAADLLSEATKSDADYSRFAKLFISG